MVINPLIFREYDIRGIAEEDLTDESVFLIGKAYGSYMMRRNKSNIAIGIDARLTSPRIKNSLIDGLINTGIKVTDLGLVPTPVLYFAIVWKKFDGGIQVTGSHNPKEYNGLKLCDGLLSLYGEQIQELKKIIETGNFVKGNGSYSEYKNITEEYIDFISLKIKLKKKLKVVIDSGNGTGGLAGPQIFKNLGCEVIELYSQPDGNFPNHLPDPVVPELIKDLISAVKKYNADIGIGYDGDSDRIGIVDNNGNIVWGDQQLALYSRKILKEKPGSLIIFDVKCSELLPMEIERLGGKPLMYKTGHSLIKAKLYETKAPLAGEMSGHMFFYDDYFGFDDAIYSSTRMAEIVSSSGESLSDLVKSLPFFHSTPELRVDCPDEVKFDVVKKIADSFSKKFNVIKIDGVRVKFKDGWGLLRASNTQPVLVLRFEATSVEKLKEIGNLFYNELRKFDNVNLNHLVKYI